MVRRKVGFSTCLTSVECAISFVALTGETTSLGWPQEKGTAHPSENVAPHGNARARIHVRYNAVKERGAYRRLQLAARFG